MRSDEAPDPRPTPAASSEEVRRRMTRQRRSDTQPELSLRRRLWGQGLRYRVDYKVLPLHRRRADLAFLGPRVAVFVDGCFWHGCPEHGTAPRSNAWWWEEKLTTNRARDQDTGSALQEAGWRVLRLWEHTEPTIAADMVEQALQRPEQR